MPRVNAIRIALATASHVRESVYPARCVACGRFREGLFCAPCAARLVPATGGGRCPFCSGPWTEAGNCPSCVGWDQLDGGRAAFAMEGPARSLVHALKYDRVRSIAPLLARAMQPLADSVPFDGAFPIPLHRSRLRSRGFNQADLVLDALRWRRADGALCRSRKTATQVGLALHERRRNVSGAFDYTGPRLDGARLVLVDDVITTGATANECARVLKEHGAREVTVVAFARANPASAVTSADF